MNATELVHAAMQKSGLTSTRTLAKELEVSHVAVAKWINGENWPSFEQAAALAILAGLPPVSTAAKVRQGSKDGAKHGRLLRQLAKVAAVVALTAGAYPATGTHEAKADNSAHNPGTVYIMLNVLRWLRYVGTKFAEIIADSITRDRTWHASANV